MIQETEVSITYVGDGSTKDFPYPYPYLDENFVVGYLIENNKAKKITTNFQFDTTDNKFKYPIQGNALNNSQKLVLVRCTTVSQEIDLPDKIPLNNIERALDKITHILQEHDSKFISVSYGNKLTSEELLEKIENYVIEAMDSAAQSANSSIQSANSSIQSANSSIKSANSALQSEDSSKVSKNYCSDAAGYAEQCKAYSQTAYATTAPAWDINSSYSYPTVVAYEDGNTYRCIGSNIIGEYPKTSKNWVLVTLNGETFFDIDYAGALMPAASPTYSSQWELDGSGGIMPAEITTELGEQVTGDSITNSDIDSLVS